MMKKLRTLTILGVVAVSTVFAGCGNNNSVQPENTPTNTTETTPENDAADNNVADNNAQQPNIENSNSDSELVQIVAIKGTPIVTMNIKDYGTVKLELYPEKAPNTVNNFIELANSGFYDGLTFHRVIDGFMIQGGDPTGTGLGGVDYSITGEFTQNGWENDLSHEQGVISMARTQDPNSAGSQFFIVSGESGATYLDEQYAGFGKVIEGLDIIDKIQKVETNDNDKPVTDVVIESIKVDTNGEEVPGVQKLGQ